MLVHFVRHGESVSNATPGGRALPHSEGDRLTERGRSQALAVAEHLAELGAERVLTSPLQRARETAELVAGRLELPVVEWGELHELRESEGYGELSPEDQRLRRWSVWMAEHGDDPCYSYKGGESFIEVRARVSRAQECLVAEGAESLIAVSHGIFMRFFLMDVLLGEEFRPRQVRRLWQLTSFNCGVSAFEHREKEIAENYATEPWSCLSWMERQWRWTRG